MSGGHPEVLDLLVDLWWDHARRYGVLPLDDRRGPSLGSLYPPHSLRARREIVVHPDAASIPSPLAPDLVNRSFRIEATVESVGDGVLLAFGGRFGGLSLFVKDGHLVFDHNNGLNHQVARSTSRIPASAMMLALEYEKTGNHAGTATLVVDGVACGSRQMERTMRSSSMFTEGLECGRDELSAVSNEYVSPFAFTGTLQHVTISLADDGGSDATALWADTVAQQ